MIYITTTTRGLMVPYNCALKSLFVTSLLYLCLLNINTTNSINHGLTVVWKFFIVRIFCFWNKDFLLALLEYSRNCFLYYDISLLVGNLEPLGVFHFWPLDFKFTSEIDQVFSIPRGVSSAVNHTVICTGWLNPRAV